MHAYPSGLIGCLIAATLVYMADERLPMLFAAPIVVSVVMLALGLLPVLWERVGP